MSNLNLEHLADPSNDDVPVLQVTPQTPIELSDVVDITNELRQTHEGVIAFAKGSLKPGSVNQTKEYNKNPGSCGWHTHGGFLNINVSRGSDVPTVFARPEDISPAISAAITAYIPQLLELDGELSPLRVDVLNLDEKPVGGQVLPLMDHLTKVMDTLALDRQKTTLDNTSQAWNILRCLFLEFGDEPTSFQRFFHQVFFNIIRRSQTGVPSDRVLAMSPKDYDAYVVPPFRAHARSLREGQLYRPQTNLFIPIDRTNGQPWKQNKWPTV